MEILDDGSDGRDTDVFEARVLDLLPGPVLVAIDEALVFANPAALEAFGAADLAALGELAPVPAHASASEHRIVRADGSVRILSWTTIDTSFGGRPARLFAIDDITELARTRDALRASEVHRRSVLGALAEGLLVVDRDGTITDANPAAASILRLSSTAALIGESVRDSPLVDTAGEPVPEASRPFRRALDERQFIRGEVFGIRAESGGVRQLRVSVLPIDADELGQPGGAVVTFDDVTDELSLRQEVRDSEVRFRLLAERSPDVVMRIGFEPLRFDYLSPAIVDLVGRSREELYDRPELIARHIHREDIDKVMAPLSTFDFNAGSHVEFRMLHRDGTIRTVESRGTVVYDGEQAIGIECTLRDITNVATERAKLAELAHRDVLTGLLNRRALMAAMDARLAARSPTAVLFCDLDSFKLVNDSHGHDAGDRVLVEFARRLAQAVRDTDVVARFAGDEFVVIATPDHADAVAARLVSALSTPIGIGGGRTVSVGVSVGITHVDTTASGGRAEDVLRSADRAMYEAKRLGKGRIVVARDAA